MKTKKIIVFVVVTLFMSYLTGCTTKSWYKGGQAEAKRNCHTQPPNEVEQCLENVNNKTYEEYKQH